MAVIKLEIDDILTLKKAHPCGSKRWKVVRSGDRYRVEVRGMW